jgi:transcriptional regulator with XRE-family HTH domain
MPTKRELAERLRDLRGEQGMTQVELAEAMGIHQTSLSQMERGVRGVGTKQILKICRALKVSPDRLLGPTSKREPSAPPRNARLLRRVRQVERLPLQHQEAIIKMLDAFLDTHAQGNGRR